jgi:hypothetical protein
MTSHSTQIITIIAFVPNAGFLGFAFLGITVHHMDTNQLLNLSGNRSR